MKNTKRIKLVFIGAFSIVVFVALLIYWLKPNILTSNKKAATTATSNIIKETQKVVDMPIVNIAEINHVDDPQPKESKDDTNAVGAKVELKSSSETVGKFETSGVTLGIDVSKWQGDINWTAVKNAGIEYAMIRTGYRTFSDGKIYEDPYAKYNMQQAQNAGIKIGVYFYSSAINENEALQEAMFTCNLISQYKITYPVTIDYEAHMENNSRNKGLTSDKRTSIVSTFLNYVKEKNYTPCLFSSQNSMQNDFNINSLSNYKIWVSQYPATPYPTTKSSSYQGKHHMWQYTSQGTVKGINGFVDVNLAYFGFTSESAAQDSKEPEKVSLKSDNGIFFQEVYEQVTAKIEVNLRSTPNTTNDNNVVAKIKNKEAIIRTGISSETNWSRVEYKGQNLYVLSNYVTTDLNDSSQADALAKNKLSEDGLYQIVNELVTAKEYVNLRKAANQTSEQCGTLNNGKTLTRVGIGSNGWSKLLYNNTYVYASSILITTDLNYVTPTSLPDVVYKEVNDQVTAIESTNLRSDPSINGTLIRQIKNGEYVTRIGVGSNNWSKIKDTDGSIVYAQTNLLKIKQ